MRWVKRSSEIAAVVLFASLQLVLAARIAGAVEGVAALPILLLAAVLGILVTDFISGLVHWFCDSFFREDTPILGRLLIRSFREHHRDPLAMTHRSFLEINHRNCVVTIVALVVALMHGGPSTELTSLLAWGFLFFLFSAIYLTNSFHRWAHEAKPPRVARLLQRARLAVGPEHHAAHHRQGRDSYCVTTGWLNPVLDRTQLFPRIERALLPLRQGTTGSG
jgi:ubiquitin-conjugating enzyme E2 variant